jgi:hypothetical protein
MHQRRDEGEGNNGTIPSHASTPAERFNADTVQRPSQSRTDFLSDLLSGGDRRCE